MGIWRMEEQARERTARWFQKEQHEGRPMGQRARYSHALKEALPGAGESEKQSWGKMTCGGWPAPDHM